MSISTEQVDHVVRQFLPFQGKDIPDWIVEKWRALDPDVQQAVRVKLRAILSRPHDHLEEEKPPFVSKREVLIGLLKRPGGISLDEICAELNSTRSSVSGMISQLKKANHPIVKTEKKRPKGDDYMHYSYGGSTLILHTIDNAPLTRAERGALGARYANYSNRRSPGASISDALRVLENAGTDGLTIIAWASALNYTPGGLYRLITTMRRDGHDIRMRRGIDGKNYYVWRGKPDPQHSLFTPKTILSVKDVAQLYGRSTSTLHNWIKIQHLPKPETYTVDGVPIHGWDKGVIEPLMKGPPPSPADRACLECGVLFATKTNKIYCSSDCRTRHHNKLHAVTQDAAAAALQVDAASDDAAEVMPSSAEIISDTPAPPWQGILDAIEDLMDEVQSLKADKESDRFPVVAALRAVDLHLPPGVNADAIIKALREGSDARTTRDWLWKLQGKIKRLAEFASQQID